LYIGEPAAWQAFNSWSLTNKLVVARLLFGHEFEFESVLVRFASVQATHTPGLFE
jgi:hypothetical protein